MDDHNATVYEYLIARELMGWAIERDIPPHNTIYTWLSAIRNDLYAAMSEDNHNMVWSAMMSE